MKCYVNHLDTGLRCASPSEITALSVRTVSDLEVSVAVGGRDNSTRLFRHSFELPADSIAPKITLSPHLDTVSRSTLQSLLQNFFQVTAIVEFEDFIATGSRDNSIKLWSSKGELVKTFSMAHADWILSMKIIPGRNAFVSVARDGSLAVSTLFVSRENFPVRISKRANLSAFILKTARKALQFEKRIFRSGQQIWRRLGTLRQLMRSRCAPSELPERMYLPVHLSKSRAKPGSFAFKKPISHLLHEIQTSEIQFHFRKKKNLSRVQFSTKPTTSTNFYLLYLI